MADRLLSLDRAEEALVELTGKLIREDGDFGKRIQVIKRKVVRLDSEIENYVAAIAEAPDVRVLATALAEKQQDRDRAQAEPDAMAESVGRETEPPDRQDILGAAKRMSEQLLARDTEASLLLRQITKPIPAVPYQRIDCDLVVLKARFRLDFVGLMADEWRRLLRGDDVDLSGSGLISEEVEIDFFDKPDPVRTAKEALALSRESSNMAAKKIAAALDPHRRIV